MSNDRFIDTLEDYLDEFDGETPLPEHVRDSIRAELPGTRQIRSGAGPRRVLAMVSNLSIPARVGLVAAAVVVAFGLGAAMIANVPPQGGVGARPSTPAASPSPEPTQAATSPSPAGLIRIYQAPLVPCGDPAGCLAPGTYLLDPFDVPGDLSLEVPEGWWPYRDGGGATGLLVDGGPEAPSGSGWGIMVSPVADVRKDPCDASAGMFPPDEVDTPQELAEAFASWPAFEVVASEAINIGGVTGVKVVLETRESLGTCSAQLWQTGHSHYVDAYPLGKADPGEYSVTFHILDVDPELVVVRSTDSAQTSPWELSQGVEPDPDRHAEHVTQQRAIIDSIRFGERN